MKAITLWQPWATLVALREKKLETRSWAANHRGTLAIHAAKQMPADAKTLCSLQPFARALDRLFAAGDELPLGCIVAVCELADCLYIHSGEQYVIPGAFTDDDQTRVLPPDEPERSFGDYTPGRFAWVLDKVQALEMPIPCRGYQQLWEVPADVEAQIKAQLGEQEQGSIHV